MALDLSQIVKQLHAALPELQRSAAAHERATRRAVELLAHHCDGELRQRMAAAGSAFRWQVPDFHGPVAERAPVPLPPADFAVVGVDGSLIEIDRHGALPCYVINVGWAVIRYGSQPSCELKAEARLEVRRLTYLEPTEQTVQRVDTTLLAVERAVEEFEWVATLVEQLPPDLPTLALVDNPLVVWWGMVDPRAAGFLRAVPASGGPSLLERYLGALERVRQACQQRPAALAGYISSPRSDVTANLLRLLECPYAPPRCRYHCPSRDPEQWPCATVATTDAELFGRYLQPGERSALFRLRQPASSPLAALGLPGPWSCYLHVGREVARVELPDWVATDPERCGLALALIADQARRGEGFPVALMEAHEQAVISHEDRQMFQRLVLEQLMTAGLPVRDTAKAASKRVAGV
jgi:GNAT superfamily N-acetyltransferase